MKPKLEATLWIAGILVFSVVLSHLRWMWRGRNVPPLAGYVDFFGIAFMLLSTTIAIGVWKTTRNDPNNLVGNAIRKISIFTLKVIFLLFVPGTLLAEFLRDRLFLGQRAMIYGVFALVSTAGFYIASRLAAKAKQDAAAATKANGG